MNLAWNDVKRYFEEEPTWSNEHDLYWYQYVWQLLDENNLTVCNSLVEKLSVYSRIYAMISIYKEFCSAAFEESPEFLSYLITDDVSKIVEEEVDDEEEQDIYKDIYNKLIEDSETMRTIFDILQAKLGITETYCSLWTTCDPVELRNVDEDGDELETEINTY